MEELERYLEEHKDPEAAIEIVITREANNIDRDRGLPWLKKALEWSEGAQMHRFYTHHRGFLTLRQGKIKECVFSGRKNWKDRSVMRRP